MILEVLVTLCNQCVYICVFFDVYGGEFEWLGQREMCFTSKDCWKKLLQLMYTTRIKFKN